MGNSKTLELEILITISQNKNVPICHYQYLFEHKWKIYSPRFNELMSDAVFNIVKPITGMPYYELTSKGKSRITELIEQRELVIAARLSHLQQQKTTPALNWKIVKARLHAAVHMWVPTEKTANSQHRSDLDNLKSWIRRSKLIPHKA